MSKYSKLWQWFANKTDEKIKLSYDEIAEIAGCKIDHSFLKYKKELATFGFSVAKISMKERYIVFERKTD